MSWPWRLSKPAPGGAGDDSILAPALRALREGRMVVLRDGEERGFEGDVLVAAEFAGPEQINFMAKEARGVVCLALSDERCEELGLVPIGRRGPVRKHPSYMVSIEAREGVTTGISVADRARTIAVASDPAHGPDDLVQPGHVFPLRSRPGGVLERTGRAEAAVDLARLAGLRPAGVLCEIMREDGHMARAGELEDFAAAHGLATVAVADVVAHRRRSESPAERFSGAGWQEVA